jgi:small-conductance mechanosensitive channel
MANILYDIMVESVSLLDIIYWIILSIVLFLVYRIYISNKKAVISSIVIGYIFTILSLYPINSVVIKSICPGPGYGPFYPFAFMFVISIINGFAFSLIIYYFYNSKIAIKIGMLTFAILFVAVNIAAGPA